MKKASSADPAPPSAVGVQACCAHGATLPERAQQDCAPAPKGSLSLWLWVVAGFLFLGLLWTGMFMAAKQADTRTVPLATKETKP